MRTSTVNDILRWTWTTPLWLTFLPFAIADQPARGADDDVVKQVLTAWQKRTESINSFQYECALERFLVKGSLRKVAGTSDRKSQKDIPPEDLLLRDTFTYSLSGDKMALWREGQQWDDHPDRRRLIKYTTAFDGNRYRSIEKGGELFRGSEAAKNNADPHNIDFRVLADMLTNSADQAALWLWFSPVASLERLGYSPGNMEASRLRTFCEGHACYELSLPKKRASAWRSLVYADPSRDYLPLQYVEQQSGIVRDNISIQYVSDGKVGWHVSAWKDKRFTNAGSLAESLSCEVKRCSVNEPLEDKVFTFEFPNSTRVHEVDSNKYYVALGGGERRYISEREYGMSPHEAPSGATSRVLFAISVTAIIIVLVFALLWRRRHREGSNLV